MTSTIIYQEIPPTYLYIKQHAITGLKYFGKTTRNPHEYIGSGTYWRRHIKKHGKEHIKTLWVSDLYYDTSISEIALQISDQNNIVESKEWANLKPENGLDGWVGGVRQSDRSKAKISDTSRGRKLSEETKVKMRKPKSKQHKENISLTLKGKSKSLEHKHNLSISAMGKVLSEETKAKMSNTRKGAIRGPARTIECPHCSLSGGVANMKRWHFDNCKFINLTEHPI